MYGRFIGHKTLYLKDINNWCLKGVINFTSIGLFKSLLNYIFYGIFKR